MGVRILANLAFRIMPALLVLLNGSITAVLLDRADRFELAVLIMASHAICAFHTIYIGLVSSAGSK